MHFLHVAVLMFQVEGVVSDVVSGVVSGVVSDVEVGLVEW